MLPSLMRRRRCCTQHIRLLRARGHFTIAAHRSNTAASAMPPWTSVRADADVVCSLHQRLSDVIPVTDIDVVVVGIFHQARVRRPTAVSSGQCSTGLRRRHAAAARARRSSSTRAQQQQQRRPRRAE